MNTEAVNKTTYAITALLLLCFLAALGLLYNQFTVQLSLPTIYLPSALLNTTLLCGILVLAFLLYRSHYRAIEAEASVGQTRRILESKERALKASQTAWQQQVNRLHRADEALRLSETRLRTVLDNAPVMVCVLDETGRFTLVQGKILRLLGVRRNDLVGSTIAEAFGKHSISIMAHYERAMNGESFVMRETVRNRTLEIHYTPLRANRFAVAGVIAVATDVTDQLRAEEAVQQSQKLESVGVLAGGIAHDFNNLLVAMMAQNSVALSRMAPQHDAFENIQQAIHAAKRAADLTQQLLAYSGRSEINLESLDFHHLLRQNHRLFQVAIPKHIQLETRLYKEPLHVECDRGQMQQIVMNLLINAVEAIGDKQGRVMLLTGQQQVTEGDSIVGLDGADKFLPAGPYVTLEVRDNGLGMDAETQQKIFDPFFTTKDSGHGLGLAAVIGIVRTHGGTLQVKSQPNRGTRFRIMLPLAAPPAPQPKQSITFKRPRIQSGTILVIDDEASVRTAAKTILESKGYQVHTVSNGARGVEALRKHGDKIDLVLLDLTMPGMNGAETHRALRALDPTVPVILSSGYDEAEATYHFHGQGLNAFLQKPYDLDALLDKVQNNVRRTRPKAATETAESMVA